MHGANTIVDPRVKTRPERHSWESNKKKIRFELQSETKGLRSSTIKEIEEKSLS